MKSATYARLFLFIPFVVLTESILYFHYHDLEANAKGLQAFNFYWNFFAIFWVIPYTILAIYLLIWSRGKAKDEIKARYILAPVLLIFLSLGIYLIAGIIGFASTKDFYRAAPILLFASIGSIPGDLIVGYLLVGFALLIYKIFQKIRVIRD